MFHISTPFDCSHSSPSPFSHFPSSSLSSVDPFLPPSYATYDEERSRIEQALLARKQQERRQAEAAAFLAGQRRLERQAAIEEAIREEREKREYERALRYREEMVRKAREEEEVKQRYIQAMRIQQELARKQQQDERRRKERAAGQQRQSSSLDTVPDLFQLLFGGRSTQNEPVSVSQPSTPSPVQPQLSHSEQPQLDLPHFLEAIFGTPRPSTATQAPPPSQQAPAPVTQSSSAPVAQTSSSPIATPALPSETPSSTTIVHQETPAESPSSDEEEEAVTKVQRQFRRHLARRNALDKISSLSSSFVDRRSSFEKPTILTFKSSPDSTSSTTTPSLAFVSSNSPFLAYEDYLVNLLSKIDAVESGGDRQVKKERKSLVRKVEKELSRLDVMKERAWEEQVKAAQITTVDSKVEDKVEPEAGIVEPEQEVAEEEGELTAILQTTISEQITDFASHYDPASPSATEPQTLDSEQSSPSVDASLPTSSPATDTTFPSADSAPAPPSDDDLEPLIPADDQNTTSKLTKEAVSSLPPHSTDIAPSRASDDASSTTSSTLTEASDDSITGEEVSRQAEKLGQEVKKLKLAENTDRNEEYVFVL